MTELYNPLTTGNGLVADATTADSTDINPHLLAIETAFNTVQAEIDRCFKTPSADPGPYVMTQNAAARASKLAVFDATGAPTATLTLPGTLDAGAYKFTQAAAATLPTDLVNLGQAASLASMGSLPAAIGITSFNVGTLLNWQGLRSNGAAALEGYKTPNTIDAERGIRRAKAATVYLF